MRVLLASHTSDMGGAERALLELLDALKSVRPDLELHVALPRAGRLQDELVARGVPHVISPSPWWAMEGRASLSRRMRFCVRALYSTLSAISVLRRLDADIVVTNTLVAPVWAFAARLSGRRHVWFVHEFGDRDHGYEFVLGAKLTRTTIGRMSQSVVVNSSSLASYLESEVPRSKIHVAHYSVEVDDRRAARSWSRPPAPAPRFCILGQVRPSKGQSDAVRAVSVLARQGVYVELEILGPAVGGHDRELWALAHDLHVADRVRVLGPVLSPSVAYQGAFAALMCSTSEAFGRVTVEAMKLGLPVVAAAAAGSAEIIRDGVTGLLYKTGDVDGLAACMHRLVRDTGLGEKLATAAAADAAERFNRRAYATAFLAALPSADSTGRASSGRSIR